MSAGEGDREREGESMTNPCLAWQNVHRKCAEKCGKIAKNEWRQREGFIICRWLRPKTMQIIHLTDSQASKQTDKHWRHTLYMVKRGQGREHGQKCENMQQANGKEIKTSKRCSTKNCWLSRQNVCWECVKRGRESRRQGEREGKGVSCGS